MVQDIFGVDGVIISRKWYNIVRFQQASMGHDPIDSLATFLIRERKENQMTTRREFAAGTTAVTAMAVAAHMNINQSER